MIKVYQIQLTNEEVDAANRGEITPRIKAYFDRGFDSKFNAENFQYYDLVANVDVDGFEQAFRTMNLWQEDENFDRVEKLGRCSSMSVGDIVEMENGTLYRCASFGFEEI